MTDSEDNGSLFTDQTFVGLDLPEPILRAVDDIGFTNLTKIQAEVLPISLGGRDVVAQAQTGSGKTAAYLLTIFAHLLRVPKSSPPETPRALIVAPTRELAVQISNDAEGLGHHAGIRTHVVFGSSAGWITANNVKSWSGAPTCWSARRVVSSTITKRARTRCDRRKWW
jgi:superfamily II DNA/RNA helicase